ncbi:hypothetical protein C7377_0505 [Balneicella halophila]|uniref:PepSY-associated transmembrane protein n=1 Tax=Balneicella halophila TaxID=1537566 RepID=A0A7L4URA8_BALHA|nr:PepSY-associated TM helix domain-containing protein [Balneicella halophila]PVX52199.1 hypothetical protein C7377_0505 [Balneicella halophila]
MKWWSKKSLNKLNRTLHRDLGYLFIGLTVIYAFSGIALVLKQYNIDIEYSEETIKNEFSPNLSKDEFKLDWSKQDELPRLTRVKIDNHSNYRLLVKGGEGVYNITTGEVKLSIFKTNKLIKFANDIHYNIGKRFTWLAILYCCMLIFFAISGAIIVKGKKGFKRRGVWFALIGIGIPVIYYFIV